MLEQLSWEEAYQSWTYGQYHLPAALSKPMAEETIPVEYHKDGCYIYGYDWLGNEEATNRKKMIRENPMQFLYFAQPTNKGTIHTAQMLVEARDEEERAAIWIAATALELKRLAFIRGGALYAEPLYQAACGFLEKRFALWHYAMRRLVPEIMIPYDLLECIDIKESQTVMHLIQVNTLLLQGAYSILRYSSLEEGRVPEHVSIRLDRVG